MTSRRPFRIPDQRLGNSSRTTNETDYSVSGENLFHVSGFYLFRQNGEATWFPPISIYGGYTRSNFTPGSFHVDTFMVGIRLYTDGNGADTLVERQRTGTLGWQTEFAPLSLRF